MIHIVDSKNFYYNSNDMTYYFVNEKSKYDNKIVEVDSNKLVIDNGILPYNEFSLVKRKRGYAVFKEENLMSKCLYFGELIEDGCLDITLDVDNTTCKVVTCYINTDKNSASARFAVLLSHRNYVCFDITDSSGERFKVIYAYYPKQKKVRSKKLPLSDWERITQNVQLSDYEDTFETEVNLELLEKFKESGMKFTKLRGGR